MIKTVKTLKKSEDKKKNRKETRKKKVKVKLMKKKMAVQRWPVYARIMSEAAVFSHFLSIELVYFKAC